MINLFIDSNVFLSFYHLTNEDLEELRKIIALIDTKQITLFLTKQVQNEFARNRGSKIVDRMKKLQEARFNLSLPAFAKDYRQYEHLRFFLKRADDKHAELIKKITDDARAAELNADKIISELFGKATVIDSTDDLCYRALMRVRLGNPPGKEYSLGDAVNWECLLETVEKGTDIYFGLRTEIFAHSSHPTASVNFCVMNGTKKRARKCISTRRCRTSLGRIFQT